MTDEQKDAIVKAAKEFVDSRPSFSGNEACMAYNELCAAFSADKQPRWTVASRDICYELSPFKGGCLVRCWERSLADRITRLLNEDEKKA